MKPALDGDQVTLSKQLVSVWQEDDYPASGACPDILMRECRIQIDSPALNVDDSSLEMNQNRIVVIAGEQHQIIGFQCLPVDGAPC